jgi:hypothetical protein
MSLFRSREDIIRIQQNEEFIRRQRGGNEFLQWQKMKLRLIAGVTTAAVLLLVALYFGIIKVY